MSGVPVTLLINQSLPLMVVDSEAERLASAAMPGQLIKQKTPVPSTSWVLLRTPATEQDNWVRVTQDASGSLPVLVLGEAGENTPTAHQKQALDSIVIAATYSELPAAGAAGVMYFVRAEGHWYQWDGESYIGTTLPQHISEALYAASNPSVTNPFVTRSDLDSVGTQDATTTEAGIVRLAREDEMGLPGSDAAVTPNVLYNCGIQLLHGGSIGATWLSLLDSQGGPRCDFSHGIPLASSQTAILLSQDGTSSGYAGWPRLTGNGGIGSGLIFGVDDTENRFTFTGGAIVNFGNYEDPYGFSADVRVNGGLQVGDTSGWGTPGFFQVHQNSDYFMLSARTMDGAHSGSINGFYNGIMYETNLESSGALRVSAGVGDLKLSSGTGNAELKTYGPGTTLDLSAAGEVKINSGTQIGLYSGVSRVVVTDQSISIGSNMLGFFQAAPVARPAKIDPAANSTDVVTKFNDLLAKLQSLGLIAS